MTFRKPANRWLGVQPAGEGLAGDSATHDLNGWRKAARDLGQRLLPAMVLMAAAVVGLAAVAIT